MTAPVVILWATGDPIGYVPTVRSLNAQVSPVEILVGGADKGMLEQRAEVLHSCGARVDRGDLSALIDESAVRGPVVFAQRPVLLPTNAFEAALEIAEDPRVATVSWWCNAAGFASFPHRNTPWSHQIEDLDEASITERLRNAPPSEGAVPIPAAFGPVALLGQGALSALGGLGDGIPGRPDAVLFEWSVRAQRRGFVNLLDPTTYVSQPFDLAAPVGDPSADPEVRVAIERRDPAVLAVLDHERNSRSSAFACAFGAARVKVFGLRVVIDGTCLGPKEMGTQVHVLNLTRALAANDAVRDVQITLAHDVPSYARDALASPKVRVVRVRDDQDVTGVEEADIAHRPFQPERPPSQAWRDSAARLLVTIQDLIAYRTGAYHMHPGRWLDYRDGLFRSVRAADGVVVISEDVRAQVELERLPVEQNRTFVVKMGTDHLTGSESEVHPGALRGRLAAHRLIVMIGANYAHKNRDLAVRAVRELRSRGHRDVALVLAGAVVPAGSSRLDESLAAGCRDPEWCANLCDVSWEERNWLLHHADLVLYPTSAEGFGLVPFEAAQFGTPVVAVSFGPLAEVLPDVPVVAADWQPTSFADAAERLLSDRDLAAAQVASTLRHAEIHTWDAAAASLVDAYHSVLAKPAR